MGKGKGARGSARGRRSNHHLSFFFIPVDNCREQNTHKPYGGSPNLSPKPNLAGLARTTSRLPYLITEQSRLAVKAQSPNLLLPEKPYSSALPVLSHSQDTNAQKWRRRRRTSRRLRAGLRTPCGPQQLLPQPEARRRHRQTQQWRRRRHVEACTRARAGTAVRTRASGRRGRM